MTKKIRKNKREEGGAAGINRASTIKKKASGERKNKIDYSTSLADILSKLRIKINTEDLASLEKSRIVKLSDIREKGGYEFLSSLGLSVQDKTIKRITAHCDLAIISSDIEVNNKIITKGYYDTFDIIKAGRIGFTKDVTESIGEVNSAKIYAGARAQEALITNWATGIRAELANGYETLEKNKQGDIEKALLSAATDMSLEGSNCECQDCESAVSPLAYLADLIKYALNHIKKTDGNSLTLDELVNRLKQPLADLPATCSAMDKQVRSIRLVIEVLRKHYDDIKDDLTVEAKDVFEVSQSNYREAAYEAILDQLGTSFTELRNARSGDEKAVKRLMLRLGVPPEMASEVLQDFLLDPQVINGAESITEARLEELFGLVDTTRDVLSDGQVLAETVEIQQQISSWNLNAEWLHNTDEFGYIYVKYEERAIEEPPPIPGPGGQDPSPLPPPIPGPGGQDPSQPPPIGGPGSQNSFYHVELNRNANYDNLQIVATGNPYSNTGSVQIGEQNSSELNGSIQLTVNSGLGEQGKRLKLSAVPKYLSYQLINLHAQWIKEDWPDDDYSTLVIQTNPLGEVVDKTPRLPVIDPDLIGPDDFYSPFSSNSNDVFAYWVKRREWVDEQIANLEDNHTNDDLNSLMAVMSEPIDYYGSAIRAWPDGYDSPTELPRLLLKLELGDDIEAVTTEIKDTLSLSVEEFSRLMEVRTKGLAAELNNQIESPSDNEWYELYSILMMAIKRRIYPEWINEEANIPDFNFGPGLFVISITDPKIGPWPPRTTDPLIDPDIINLKGMPDSSIKWRSHEIWQARKIQIQDTIEGFASDRQANGIENVLVAELGESAAAMLDIYNDLASADPNVVDAARQEVKNTLNLNVDDFVIIIDVLNRVSSGDKEQHPSDSEWAKVDKILAKHKKITVFYPDWLNEEDPNLGIKNYTSLKTTLPLWRASYEARAKWQDALRRRSAEPIVDPDQINLGYIRGAESDTSIAADLWEARLDDLQQLENQLQSLIDAVNSDTTPAVEAWHRIVQITVFPPRTADIHSARYTRLLQAGRSVNVILVQHFGRVIEELDRLFQNLQNNVDIPLTTKEIHQGLLIPIADFSSLMELRLVLNDGTATEEQQQKFCRLLGEHTILKELLLLNEQSDLGYDITPRLQQLGIIRGEYNRIVELREYLANGNSLLQSEWEDISAVGVTIYKRLQFSRWRRDEQLAGLIVSPQLFQIPETIIYEPPLPWRQNYRQFRRWLTMLRSRLDQQQAVTEEYYTAIDEAEAQSMPSLQEALIKVHGGEISMLARKLAIDLTVGSCQKTTRVGQAIVTSQSLHESAKSGYLENYGLELDAPDFTEEWTWLGSYETWRAAMFTYIYPENLLDPRLRVKRSPAFNDLLDSLRRQRVVSSEMALESAKSFSDYLEDIVVMEPVMSCYAESQIEPAFFLFGIGGRSKALYWCRYDSGKPVGSRQMYWQRVPNVDLKISKIISAYPQLIRTKPNKFYLILVFKDENGSFQITRYDLWENRWIDDGAIEFDLQLPAEVRSIGAQILVGRYKESGYGYQNTAPIVLLKSKLIEGQNRYVYYISYIEPEGTSLRAEWGQITTRPTDPTSHKNIFTNEFQRVSATVPRWFTYLDNSHLLIVVQIGFTELGHTYYRVIANVFELMGENSSWVRVMDRAVDVSDAAQECYFHQVIEDDRGVYVFYRVGSDEGELQCTKVNFSRQNPSAGLSVNDLEIQAPISQVVPLSQPHTDYWPTRFAYQDESSGNYLHGQLSSTLTVDNLVFASLPSYFRENRFPNRITPTRSRQYHQDYLQLSEIHNTFLSMDEVGYMTLVEEEDYFSRIALALALNKSGDFNSALSWYRSVYDDTSLGDAAKQTYLFHQTFSTPDTLPGINWINDPLNPHEIAKTRSHAYLRYTVMNMVRAYLAYADREFTQDSIETVTRARTFYERALRLLEVPELKQASGICRELRIQSINALSTVLDESVQPLMANLELSLEHNQSSASLRGLAVELKKLASKKSGEAGRVRVAKARDIVKQILKKRPITFSDVLNKDAEKEKFLLTTLMKDRRFTDTSSVTTTLVNRGSITSTELAGKELAVEAVSPMFIAELQPKVFRSPSFSFCIPMNPMPTFMRMYTEAQLYKIRTCRNIAGMERVLEPYSAPTDTVSGLPGAGRYSGTINRNRILISPTPYRYSVIIERAKQFVQLAQQMENAFLTALEKRDVEAYNLLKAKQDQRMARTGIRLQDLRVREAEGNIELSELQEERAAIQVEGLDEMIATGLLSYEQEIIGSYNLISIINLATETGQGLLNLAIIQSGFYGAAAGGIGASVELGRMLAQARLIEEQNNVNVNSIWANYARRAQEWEYQKTLATQDGKIASQQTKIAKTHVKVVEQERAIANMQADFASDVVEFLGNKFTNEDLYEWMGDVLEGVYSYFLGQATSLAKLAENQLAFERQEIPPALIKSDYWEVIQEESYGNEEQATDRRGITGSARLMQDIYQLDQFAFDTDKRKLQLSKTISLARMAPEEMQSLRENGIMHFDTPMRLFDHDFPGHYLRLIKRVRITVVALIPSNEGIKATLSASGISRVVIGGVTFEEVRIRRSPESVALTSPYNSMGVFEMQPELEKLMPFEGMGVDTSWELLLPKTTNRFDFNTIADVLITIEYTALDSNDYRQKVIRELDDTISGDIPFSIKQSFPDAWYHLNHPVDDDAFIEASFETSLRDIPPNIHEVTISNVLVHISTYDIEAIEEVSIQLNFSYQEDGRTRDVGGESEHIDGTVSTASGKASAWNQVRNKSPVGKWTIGLTNTSVLRELIRTGGLQDILFVITYSGRTPPWPN